LNIHLQPQNWIPYRTKTLSLGNHHAIALDWLKVQACWRCQHQHQADSTVGVCV